MADAAKARMVFYTAVFGTDDRLHIRYRDLGFVDRRAFPGREDAIRFYTEQWVGALEDEVRLVPEQYFWVHQRWKTKPGDFPIR